MTQLIARWRVIEQAPNPGEQADSSPNDAPQPPAVSDPPKLDPPKIDPAKPAPAKPDETFAPKGQFAVEALLHHVYTKEKARPSFSGKRQQSDQNRTGGQTVGTTQAIGSATDIGVAATLRASGLRKSISGRGELPKTSLPDSRLPTNSSSEQPAHVPNLGLITKDDLRFKVRQAKVGTLILFVVDSSGSMGARKRMELVKGAILDLLGDAYRKRDRVGMVIFRGEGARVLVPPTNSVELAEQKLRQLPTGGKTPLAAGLHLADQLLESQLRQAPGLVPLLVLVTDGRGNVGPSPAKSAMGLAKKGYPALVLDSEQGYVRLGDALQLAHALNAAYAPLEQLAQVMSTVR